MRLEVNEYTTLKDLKAVVNEHKNYTFNEPIELVYTEEFEKLAGKVQAEILDLGFEFSGQYTKELSTIKEFY